VIDQQPHLAGLTIESRRGQIRFSQSCQQTIFDNVAQTWSAFCA
jgi:hypothetical protein